MSLLKFFRRNGIEEKAIKQAEKIVKEEKKAEKKPAKKRTTKKK